MTDDPLPRDSEQAVATPVEKALAKIHACENLLSDERGDELNITARRLYAAAENALARVRRAHATREAAYQPSEAEDQGGAQ